MTKQKKFFLLPLIFMFSFALCLVVGRKVTKRNPQFLSVNSSFQNMTPGVPGDSYIAFLGTPISHHTVDHVVLYHNLKDWTQYAKSADVLFAGNSKTLYAFHIPQFQEMMKPRDLTFYNLGFQQAEGVGFTKILFDRYNLRPKVLIINGEEFFPRDASAFAEFVMSHTRWAAWRSVLEDEAVFEAMSQIHKTSYLPYWLTTVPARIILRSLRTGAWHWGFEQDGKQPVVFDPTVPWPEPPRDWVIERARVFNKYLQERGTQLIIAWVPKEIPSNFTEVKAIAEAIQVPLVAVSPEGLYTFDHDHMSFESGRIFTERMVTELKKNSTFQQIFAKD